MDPWARRNAMLARLAERWEEEPPAYPVIGAGSTGSVPTTRDLLAAIARLPQGTVILPGLDTEADDETWEAIGPTHPQYALKGLLAHIGVARSAVEPWPWPDGGDGGNARARSRLIADAMRPAETITRWRVLARRDAASLRDVHRIDCASPQEEAGVIAIIMRRALETPGRTAAPGDGGPRARPPGRCGAHALADSGGRFGRRALGRDEARRLSQAHRAARCRRRGACPPARRPQASAGRRRHGTGGMAPFRAGHGDGDPARAPAGARLRRPRGGAEERRCRHRTLAGAAGSGCCALRRRHGAGGRCPGRPVGGPHRVRGTARGDRRRDGGRAALVGRGGRAGGALPDGVAGGRAGTAAGCAARTLPGAARCADGGPCGPPALRPPSPPSDLGSPGGPLAACRLHDSGRAQRGRLAAGGRGRSLDEPAHARGTRPAAAGASHRSVCP